MNYSVKISVLGAFMLLSASVYSQSDSLGMPGDNLDLNAVLSIFKQSSNIEEFEKKLNSADTKVNNLDLNNDGQVDYLRVVDYGKDEFHSIVIQDPVSKLESQDVAVIEIVKKDNNTAHVQIVGDETLYGKDYIIEPKDQAPLQSSSSGKKNTTVNDDVYADPDSPANTQVMINVWAWPSVTYIYSPSYVYWASPWYWGYYPGWYSPWQPYGWYSYHRGFVGYNYGFYGYRRHHHAFPHVHNYYYGRRVSSSYVQKTAPRYGAHRDGANKSGNRDGQNRNAGSNRPVSNAPRSNSGNQVKTREQGNRVQNSQNRQSNSTRTERSTNTKQSQGGNKGQRVNTTPRSGGSSGGSRSTGGGGRSSGGGGSRGSSGGGGGARGGGGHR